MVFCSESDENWKGIVLARAVRTLEQRFSEERLKKIFEAEELNSAVLWDNGRHDR